MFSLYSTSCAFVGKALVDQFQSIPQTISEDDELDVPEEVEVVLEELFKALRDTCDGK